MSFKARLLSYVHHLVSYSVMEECTRAAFRTGWDVIQPKTRPIPEHLKCSCTSLRGDDADCEWHGLAYSYRAFGREIGSSY